MLAAVSKTDKMSSSVTESTVGNQETLADDSSAAFLMKAIAMREYHNPLA